jgi:hypothetical protein
MIQGCLVFSTACVSHCDIAFTDFRSSDEVARPKIF